MLRVKPWVGEGEKAAAVGRELINLEALSCLRNPFLKKQGISKLDRMLASSSGGQDVPG